MILTVPTPRHPQPTFTGSLPLRIMKQKRAFTLIELLLVIGIIAILTAMLFPVFSRVRGQAKQTVCASNLRQIGIAITLYAQDSDDLLPQADDPDDKFTNAWEDASGGQYWPQIQQYPLLNDVLQPYTENKQIWHCPNDMGLSAVQTHYLNGLSAKPDMYSVYGTSYFYHTELALRHETLGSLVAFSPDSPYTEYGSSEIDILHDAVGNWHGGEDYMTARYNMLMGDGHVSSVSEERHQELLNVIANRPTAP